MVAEETFSDGLSIFVVYDRPSDFPNSVVVRLFIGERATLNYHLYPDLASAREFLQSMGLTCLPRSPEDDPCIVESWI